MMMQYIQNGGQLFASGTSLDTRNLFRDDLRPRSAMNELLRIIEDGDKVITIG